MDNLYSIAALWMGLAFVAALIAIWTVISVTPMEIGVGILIGSVFGLIARIDRPPRRPASIHRKVDR